MNDPAVHVVGAAFVVVGLTAGAWCLAALALWFVDQFRARKARRYWQQRQDKARHPASRVARSDYHSRCLDGIHGPEARAEAERIDAVLRGIEEASA